MRQWYVLWRPFRLVGQRLAEEADIGSFSQGEHRLAEAELEDGLLVRQA